MVEQLQAFSPQGEGIKVKFLAEQKAVLFCSGACNIEFLKWSEILKGFLLCFMFRHLKTLILKVLLE